MTTPFNETDFIQIKNLSDDEIYKKEETGTMVSFSGFLFLDTANKLISQILSI